MDIKYPVEIENYERKIYDLRQLIEISKGLNSTLDYNSLIDSILFTCMGQMQLLKAGIFLQRGIGSDNYTLHRNYKGFELDHMKEYEIEQTSGVFKILQERTKCLTFDEINKVVPKNDKGLQILKILNPGLMVPLTSKGKVNGIIILGDRINMNLNKFTDSEKQYLLDIASLAGLAIHNSYLYEMATTDMMTKLKIHHYFQSALVDEIDRTLKTKRTLSLIMADIDHFKEFNDTYGHTAGDVVIKNVALLIKDNLRPTDIAARYGGEEFSVILPKTDIHEALIVAERIRQFIEESEVLYDGKILKATISIGITQFDQTLDFSSHDFIERADRALYESKRNGRNTVSIL
jgi:diguanylate cyclase (GGDEF)-like protein